MNNELTAAEIEEAIMAARIFSPSYGPEEFQASKELVARLQDSGDLGAVHGLARLEKERGVACTEALDTYEQLLRDNAELEQKVTDYRATLEVVQGEASQAQDKLHQVEEATKQAKADREREEKELVAFRKRAEREKQRVDQELEEYQQKAGVTREEITGATQLKDQLASRGFTIEFTLDLCQEFVSHENAREELARALKEYQTLTNHNKQAEGRQEALQADIKGLEGGRQQLESKLSQLRADVAFDEKVRQFYHRYQGASTLMEHVATWRNIFFVRCGNPLYVATSVLDRSTRGARFWTEKRPLRRCPCCDYPGAHYDEELYQALNWTVGDPFQLKLGE